MPDVRSEYVLVHSLDDEINCSAMAPALAARAIRCKPSAKRDLRSASQVSGSYGIASLGVALATSAGTSASLRSPYLREWASQMSPALNASRKWLKTAPPRGGAHHLYSGADAISRRAAERSAGGRRWFPFLRRCWQQPTMVQQPGRHEYQAPAACAVHNVGSDDTREQHVPADRQPMCR